MATRKSPAKMVGSDSSIEAQVVDKVIRPEGIKTIDDVTPDETNRTDVGAPADSPDAARIPPSTAYQAQDAKDFPWVVRFALFTGQDPSAMVALAREDEAPAEAVTKKSSGWVTIDKINPDTAADLAAIVLTT